MRDGWYWHVDKDMHAHMYRLWTPASRNQQMYHNGRSRMSPRERDALLADKSRWHKCPHPGAATFVSKRW